MFRTSWIQGAVGGFAVLAVLLLLGSDASAQRVNIQKGKFDDAQSKGAMKAFRMKQGFKGERDAEKLAKDLFEKARKRGERVSLKEDKSGGLMHVSKDDPSGFFRIDKKTGDFSFSKGMDGYAGEGETRRLPPKERAADLAKKLLADLGEMPENQDQLVERHVGGMRMAELKDDGSVTEVDKLVTVQFGRQIDGVDVSGPGSKIIVTLGADGELVSLTKRWIDATEEQHQAADFDSKQEVEAKIQAKMKGEAGKAKKIDVNVPDFGYFDDGQGNIEPAYFYTADLEYDSIEEGGRGNSHKEKFFGIVPALKNSKADFRQEEKAKIPPGRTRKPTKESAKQDDE